MPYLRKHLTRTLLTDQTIVIEALGVGAVSLIPGLALGARHLYYSLVSLIRVTVLIRAAGPTEAAVRGLFAEALEHE